MPRLASFAAGRGLGLGFVFRSLLGDFCFVSGLGLDFASDCGLDLDFAAEFGWETADCLGSGWGRVVGFGPLFLLRW